LSDPLDRFAQYLSKDQYLQASSVDFEIQGMYVQFLFKLFIKSLDETTENYILQSDSVKYNEINKL
jgi:hypothetical protein